MKKCFVFWLVLMTMLLAACGANARMSHGSEGGGQHTSGMPMDDQPAVTVGGLEIYTPRAMSGTKGQVTGGFMVIKNNGATADRLLGASCGAAMMTQVHETVMDGDVMKMREVKSIEIPAGGMVELKHGGYHIMLMDLKQDVKAGETTSCTLKFENAGEVTVELQVMSR
ncbi:MAG: copper chaperone PCu(A)C [Anaerolineales bacterium]|nr:copper chaperone PCu(A)C [Anaerolineales bacterium]MCX7755100.1 copper chaperone PCu(A)C [Anaerolineales bacterium]MDW8277547.1 copper chaperone PCu(A)C [Anaerolineales bacterium]